MLPKWTKVNNNFIYVDTESLISLLKSHDVYADIAGDVKNGLKHSNMMKENEWDHHV